MPRLARATQDTPRRHSHESVFQSDVWDTLDTRRAGGASRDLVVVAGHAAVTAARGLSAVAPAPGIDKSRRNAGAHATVAAPAPALCGSTRHRRARGAGMGRTEIGGEQWPAGSLCRQWLDGSAELECAACRDFRCTGDGSARRTGRCDPADGFAAAGCDTSFRW